MKTIQAARNCAAMEPTRTIGMIAKEHFKWLNEMGWVNQSCLEDLGMIASELGECVGEYDIKSCCISEAFQTEIADVVLRVLGVFEKNDLSVSDLIKEGLSARKIDLEEGSYTPTIIGERIIGSMAKELPGWLALSPMEHLARLLVPLSKAINEARKAELGPDFKIQMTNFLFEILALSYMMMLNIDEAIEGKVTKNLTKGKNRSRIK